MEIARELIVRKVAGQARTLRELEALVPVGESAWSVVESAQARLRVAASRDDVRVAEAAAAAAYWSAWAPLQPRWARRDADRVPAHWRRFGARSSPLTGGPRLAASPANALLNYLYAILEGEASIAARVVGLDPGLGVLHADQLNRDSLPADLMEPVRPMVDRYVLELLSRRTLAAADFFETRQGVVRVTPPLARELAATSTEWGRMAGRIAEDVARMLERGIADATSSARGASTSRWGRPMATPLSGRNRSAGRGEAARVGRAFAIPVGGRSCIQCGAPTQPGRITCGAACEDAARSVGLAAFTAAGTKVLAARHAEGRAGELTDAGRGRLKELASQRVRDARAWQRGHAWPPDPGRFAREILPGLADVPVRELVAATGLSDAYCRRIRRGQVVPHPMWWERLEGLLPRPGP